MARVSTPTELKTKMAKRSLVEVQIQPFPAYFGENPEDIQPELIRTYDPRPIDYTALFSLLVSWDYVEPYVEPRLQGTSIIQWHDRLLMSIEEWKGSLPSGLGPNDYVYLCLALDCPVPVLEAIFYNAPLHQTGHIPSHFFERLEARPDVRRGMHWLLKPVCGLLMPPSSPRFNQINLATMRSTNDLLRALFK